MAFSTRKILVTGAGGFIGYHLANHLAESGYRVIGIDIHFPADSKQIHFEKIETDFRDWEVMKDLMVGVDVVFHLASAHLQISLDESEYWDINVNSLKPLLELARKNNIKRFIHVSSVGIYGNLKTWPADEESECNPQSIYGETKIAGEAEVLNFSQKTGFPVVIIRPAWVFGPGCPRTLKIYKTLQKKRFVMIGDGQNLRHPVFIRDMLQSFLLAMENEEAVGKTFIIGGDRPITTNELIKGFVNILNTPEPIIRIPYSLGKTIAHASERIFKIIKKEPPISTRSLEFFDTNNAFDITKARKLLNFNPKFSYEDGLRESSEWLSSQEGN